VIPPNAALKFEVATAGVRRVTSALCSDGSGLAQARLWMRHGALDRFVDSDLLSGLQWKLGSRILVVGRNRYRLPQPSLGSERQRSDVWALLPERLLGHLVSLVQVRRRLPEMELKPSSRCA
jgi:hypothetical protein